ncbi:MAG: BrnA antitoxin family protein [Reyranella sp.]
MSGALSAMSSLYFKCIYICGINRTMKPMKKRLPSLASDRAAETFVAESDLSAYDLSSLRLVRYELKPKDRAISVRLPDELLKAVRSRAKRAGIPYQRFIRIALEQAVQNGRRSS